MIQPTWIIQILIVRLMNFIHCNKALPFHSHLLIEVARSFEELSSAGGYIFRHYYFIKFTRCVFSDKHQHELQPAETSIARQPSHRYGGRCQFEMYFTTLNYLSATSISRSSRTVHTRNIAWLASRISCSLLITSDFTIVSYHFISLRFIHTGQACVLYLRYCS